MRKVMNNKTGFTLVELIMVIVILGLLAAVAVPQFFNLSTDANTAAEQGVVGGVRAGITTYWAGNNRTYPATLDSAGTAVCDSSNICFDTVLAQGGITSDWSKTSATQYLGPAGTTYAYTASSGTFQ